MYRLRTLKTELKHLTHSGRYVIIRNNSSNGEYSINKDNQSVYINIGNKKNVTLSTGKYARFANGTGICRMGDTTMMVTAVARETAGSARNFMPLMVDYRQKYSSAGRISSNFFRRDAGVSEKEILSSRLIDRSVRPLFSAYFTNDTQLTCTMLALGSMYLPDVPSINAASFALAVSDIPWDGPVGAVRVGLIDDEVILNPTRLELQSSSMDLIVTGTKQKLVVMIEGKANAVPYQSVMNAINKGCKACRLISNAIDEFRVEFGKPKREIKVQEPMDQEILDAIRSMSEMRLNEVFQNYSHDKTSRDLAVKTIRDDVVSKVRSSYPTAEVPVITNEYNKLAKSVFRELIFNNKRCDGRTLDQLRPISCEMNMHEPLHGSALFQRGQTQVLATVNLDSIDSAMNVDPLSSLNTGFKAKNFFLHYEFPAYAIGEIGRVGSYKRREIGHGALAEKALLPIIPSDFPFSIRLISEVLESNGSSSMATVCAGSLALKDAGVPISSPVAGIAMGLVTKYNPEDATDLVDYRILTDILGIEDYFGDMDMKIAATKEGVTVIQADIKTNGLPLSVINLAVEQSIKPKNQILDTMTKCTESQRLYRKECLPVTNELVVNPGQKIALVGPNGVNLKRIFHETGVQVTEIKENTFSLFAPSPMALNEAELLIKELLTPKTASKFEFGSTHVAKIVEVKEHGVMVTLYDGMQPTLIHVAQLDSKRIATPAELGFEVGHEINVKYFGNDPVSGFMRLSRKALASSNS